MPDLSSVLAGVETLARTNGRASVPQAKVKLQVAEVLTALDSFGEIVRYLNTRRNKVVTITSEAAVQDVLYMMTRPWLHDLVPENPTDRTANTYSIKDFVSKETRIVVEAKFVRNREHGKSITQEINHDIEMYRYHLSCDDLIFFIYDPENHIPDTLALERHVQTSRTYGDKTLRCHAVIKP